jgi:DNA polymerase III delta subunit
MSKNQILLTGNQYDVDKTIRVIEKKINPDCILKIDSKEASAQDICGQIATPDMFGLKKLIFIHDLPSKGVKDILAYLPKVPKTNCVVFYSYTSLAKQKKLCEYFNKNAKVVSFDVEVKNLDRLVTNFFQKHEKQVSDEVVAMICQFLGANLAIMMSELEKLIFYIGDQEEVTEDDVREICCFNQEFVIWDIVNALSGKNVVKAMEILSIVVENDHSFDHILVMLARAVKLSLLLKDGEMRKEALQDTVGNIKKLKKPNGAIMFGDYEIRKTYENSNSFYNNYKYAELCMSLNYIYNAMLNIRKSYKKEEKNREMSLLMMALCYPKSVSIEYESGVLHE